MTKVFVALDFPRAGEALSLARQLVPVNPYCKVGLELYCAEGPEIVKSLTALGAEVFLDLKFHDIPNTVAGAVRSAVATGASFINVHCGGGRQMLEAAVNACASESQKLGITRPRLLGVTVLTSLDDAAVQEIGFPRSASAQVKHFLDLALSTKLDGVVCSAEELPLVRSLAPASFTAMVPGIRPEGSAVNDQKRTLTPSQAVKAGANCLVVGRPITAARDPLAELKKILAEVNA
jgi:orotidine-5'-phosphate decarboxylase